MNLQIDETVTNQQNKQELKDSLHANLSHNGLGGSDQEYMPNLAATAKAPEIRLPRNMHI